MMNIDLKHWIMKKYFLTIIAVVLTVSALVSCGRNKGKDVIKEFENLVEAVEKQKGELTAEEWIEVQADFEKRFEKLGIEDIDEADFTMMQKIELTALIVRWQAAMMESMPTLMETAIEKETGMTSEEIEEAIGEGLGEIGETLDSDEMKEGVEEIKEGLDELRKLLGK